MTKPAIDILTEEYATWLKKHDVSWSEGDATELLMAFGHLMTLEARTWLVDFIERWESAASVDPEFYDKQTVVEA